jgi:di/tricarboxylate transporter
MTAKALGVSPIGLCLLVQAAALCAFMTPMATATAPMIMGLGGYDVKSMLKQGLLPGLAIWLISTAWAVIVFPISL